MLNIIRTILLMLFLLLNVFCMSQSVRKKMQTAKAPSKISIKIAKSKISEYNGILDSSLSKETLNPCYLLNDGTVIVWFGTHAFIHNSLKDLEDWREYLRQKQLSSTPQHILKGRLMYGNNFEDHVDELIYNINETFKLADVGPSIENLKCIDKVLSQKKVPIDNILFSGLVAYVGKIFISNLPNSSWEIVISLTDSSVYEPFVTQNGKRYNPFFIVYREIFEELPETNEVSIYDRVIMELAKK